jgi:hypothetical protein
MNYNYEVEITRVGSDEVLATTVFTSEKEMSGFAEGMRRDGFKARIYRMVKDMSRQLLTE